MIQEETVFILGAGASCHLGYPLGKDLWGKIVKQLSPIKNFGKISKEEFVIEKERKKNRELLIKLSFSEQHIQEFYTNLNGYSPYTLDEFLENNPKYAELAKFAIAQVLMPYEDGKVLIGQQDWYQKIFELMKSPVNQFHKNKATFISYNYDRSLEQYLFQKLQFSQIDKKDECAAIVNQLKFIHIYGKLGDLPWQGQDGRPYQKNCNLDGLRKAAVGIKTTNEQQNLEILNSIFRNAKKILFLGFGFDLFNLKKLNLSPWINGTKSIAGTAFHLESDKKRLAEAYFNENNYKIILSDCTIIDFLRNINFS